MNAMTQTKALTFAALAKEALDESDGDKAAACAWLDDRLTSDKTLRRALIANAIEMAVKTSINIETMQKRSLVAQMAQREGKGQAGVKALASGMALSLLDYPMSDGTPLRDADRDKIAITRDNAATRAKTLSHRARFLSAVYDLVPDKGVAGDVLDEATAQKLWKDAE